MNTEPVTPKEPTTTEAVPEPMTGNRYGPQVVPMPKAPETPAPPAEPAS